MFLKVVTCDLKGLYSGCYCKDCKSVPHSLNFISAKLNMASTLNKVLSWTIFSLFMDVT